MRQRQRRKPGAARARSAGPSPGPTQATDGPAKQLIGSIGQAARGRLGINALERIPRRGALPASGVVAPARQQANVCDLRESPTRWRASTGGAASRAGALQGSVRVPSAGRARSAQGRTKPTGGIRSQLAEEVRHGLMSAWALRARARFGYGHRKMESARAASKKLRTRWLSSL